MAVNLGTGAAQLALVAAADGDEAAEADLPVTGRELGLAPGGGLLSLALACGLGLPEAPTQLTVSAVSSDRCLDLARRRRSGETGSNVTPDGTQTMSESASSASMNIGETSIRGQPLIQWVACTAPSLR